MSTDVFVELKSLMYMTWVLGGAFCPKLEWDQCMIKYLGKKTIQKYNTCPVGHH